MNCRTCGNTSPVEAIFCWHCGQRFQVNTPGDALQAAYGLSRAALNPAAPHAPRKITSWKRLAVLSVLAVGIGLGIAKLIYVLWNNQAGERERQLQSLVAAQEIVKRGLLITAVRPSSAAEIYGLRPNDIVVRYGESTVEDITTYVAAAEAQPIDQRVKLTVFREGKETYLRVPAGYLGFLFDDWNPVRKRIYDLLAKRDIKRAAELAADAQRDGSLTEAQALIVKILLIPDRSDKPKERERSELLTTLLSVYPAIHLCHLANSEFYALRSYAAAARCYAEQLEQIDSEDVDARLNLASCYVKLFEFDSAEANVRYIVDQPEPRLSAHGVHVAHQVLGGIALGRHRYREALTHFLPYLDGDDDYTLMMSLLAVAKLGDFGRFKEISDRALSNRSARDANRLQFYIDTLNAYALAETGKREQAAALVQKWGTPEEILAAAASYWNSIPGGDGIADRVRSLMKSS